MRVVLAGLVLALAGCGIDGPPIAPSDHPVPPPGVTVSGDARIGMVTGL